MSLLEVQNLSQSYGGLKVVDNVSFSMRTGEKIGLIGPNGAGKTTLINLLSGLLPAKAGRICFLDQDITKMPTHKRIRMGMARSFQLETLFLNISLLANVLLALQGTTTLCYQMIRPFMSYKNSLAEAKRLLELVNLWGKKDANISALSHGERRQVEILLSLASKPKLLMLDEPSAGLSSSDTEGMINIIRNLAKDTSVFFVAHDMDVVFSLADRVVVLYYGKLIADGTPEEIQRDSKVKEIYLGSEDEGETA